MDIIYWSVRSSNRRGNKVKGVDGGIFILASCEYHFIRVHENLGQDPSNQSREYIERIYKESICMLIDVI